MIAITINKFISNTNILRIVFIFSNRGRWLQRKVWIIKGFELHSCPRDVLKEFFYFLLKMIQPSQKSLQIKNWEKWGTGAQWNYLIIFYNYEYDIILKLDLHSNKSKLSQKGDLLSQGHEKSFKNIIKTPTKIVRLPKK